MSQDIVRILMEKLGKPLVIRQIRQGFPPQKFELYAIFWTRQIRCHMSYSVAPVLTEVHITANAVQIYY